MWKTKKRNLPTSPVINILHLIAPDQNIRLPFNPLTVFLLKSKQEIPSQNVGYKLQKFHTFKGLSQCKNKRYLQVSLDCAVTVSQLNEFICYSCHVANIPNF